MLRKRRNSISDITDQSGEISRKYQKLSESNHTGFMDNQMKHYKEEGDKPKYI